MDHHLEKIVALHAEKTVAALKANRMDAVYLPGPEELISRLEEMIPRGAEISSGGSMTLMETGVEAFLSSGNYRYYTLGGRHAEPGEAEDIYRKAYTCDWYFMSANAVTENGELYNIDGNGNRVSALIYGPKAVAVVVGSNKLVRDVAAAEARLRAVAAPANSARLGRATGCSKTGYCVNCKTEERICCHTVVSGYQRHPGRIKVFILSGSYGY